MSAHHPTHVVTRRCYLLTASLLLALGACVASADTHQGPEVTDTTEILSVHLEERSERSPPTWESDLVFSTEPYDSLPLANFAEAGFLPDGSLLVSRFTELLLFDPAGLLLRRLGRRGDGPGEFRGAFHLLIGSDSTVTVTEFGSGRLSTLRPTGEVVRIVPRLRVAAEMAVDPITILADGRTLATYWQARPNRSIPGIGIGPIERDSAPLMVYDSTGVSTDRLGLWLGLERAQVRLADEPARLPLRFARGVAYDGRGSATVIGLTDSLNLSLYVDTTLVLRLTGSSPAVQPSGDMIAEWERAVREADPTVAQSYIRAIRTAPVVSALPVVGAVVLDDQANIWVGAYVAPGQSTRQWRIFSSTGVPLGQLDLPAWTDPIFPGRSELLDVAGDRLVLLRISPSGEPVLEVRAVRH